jgi:NAD(P)-dependent dehydrogenase (short-subunit alcohol dehydrogenase family)
VNNAAFGPIGALEDTRPSTLEHTLAVNLVGPHRLVRRVLPPMRRRAWGVIVNVGSINGFVADPMLGAYSASKAGLSMYTEILAYEVGHFGIRVHLLEPGGFATGIHQRAPWEPGGLDPENPYYPLQVACWGTRRRGPPKPSAIRTPSPEQLSMRSRTQRHRCSCQSRRTPPRSDGGSSVSMNEHADRG